MSASNKQLDDDFKQKVQSLIEAYCKKFNDENDDPIDDFIRILCLLSSEINLTNLNISNQKLGNKYQDFLKYVAEITHTINPSLGYEEWSYLFDELFKTKYGGGYVYLKRKPAGSMQNSAKTMTPSELMAKYGISRAYAYKLRKSALQKK